MAEVLREDRLVIEAWETYAKQSIRNHCDICGPNGRQRLTIPVIRTNGNHTLTRDVRVSYHQPWNIFHWRSIETGYNNSPFFLYYRDEFQPVFERRFDFLIDLNMAFLGVLLGIFQKKPLVLYTENFSRHRQGETDLRTAFSKSGIRAGSGQNQGIYPQVFAERHGFSPGLSTIDLLFNIGPESINFLTSL
jgi:hypothetical protein